MKIIIFLLLFLSIFAPDPDPECISDWELLWEIQECPYCNEIEPYGTYSLYSCEVMKFSESLGEYKTIKFKSQCIYSAGIEIPPEDVYVSFLPVVTTGCPDGAWLDNGYCVRLIPPVTNP